MRRRQPPPGAWAAWLVFAVAFLVYNSNGREIQSYDSQPTKYAARELALHGRLTLDDVVASAPALAERHSFQRDLTGHFRSAYRSCRRSKGPWSAGCCTRPDWSI